MLEALEILLILFGFLIVLRGFFFSFLVKKDIKYIGGMELEPQIAGALAFFLVFTSLLFTLLFLSNNKLGLIDFTLKFDLKYFFQETISTLISSFFEEVLFRLFFFIGLIDVIKNRIILLLLSSLVFSSIHFPSNEILVTSYFLGGVIYGYSYLKFQNFWLPVVIHFTWNFLQGSIFGFSVSGSTSSGIFDLKITESIIWNGEPYGPENSFAGLIVRLALLLFIYLYPYKKTNSRFLNLDNQIMVNKN